MPKQINLTKKTLNQIHGKVLKWKRHLFY
jgi:hypothetical protein